MSGSDSAKMSAWVQRVLGVPVSPSGAMPRPEIAARLAALDPGIRTFAARAGEDASRGTRLAAAEAERLAAQGDVEGASSLLDRAEAMLREGALRQAVARWQAARAAAIAVLSTLEAAMRRSQAPDREAAAGLVQGVASRLQEQPDTAGRIEDMRRYLASDGVLAAAEGPNVLGVTVSVRQPLDRVLADLGAALAAGQRFR